MKKEKRNTVLNIRVPERVKNNLSEEAEKGGDSVTLSDICNNKLDNENRDKG